MKNRLGLEEQVKRKAPCEQACRDWSGGCQFKGLKMAAMQCCRSVMGRRELGSTEQGNAEPGCVVILLGQQGDFHLYKYICSMAARSITGW